MTNNCHLQKSRSAPGWCYSATFFVRGHSRCLPYPPSLILCWLLCLRQLILTYGLSSPLLTWMGQLRFRFLSGWRVTMAGQKGSPSV
jgi:hypothetical protein